MKIETSGRSLFCLDTFRNSSVSFFLKTENIGFFCLANLMIAPRRGDGGGQGAGDVLASSLAVTAALVVSSRGHN